MATDSVKSQSTGPADHGPVRPSRRSPQEQGLPTDESGILPRAKRRRQRPAQDRGLPNDEQLQTLARTYLQVQTRLWPELVEAGLIPPASPAILAQMVEQYRHRHHTGQTPAFDLNTLPDRTITIGGNYNRFSCDNSQPKSIVDQMVEAVTRAQRDRCFIPWNYVCADYSVSGLDPSRQGYGSYKHLLAQWQHPIRTTYIADFTRASREEIEWWKLAYLSKSLGKGMIGAEDGFSLDDPDWDMKLTIYALQSRMFMKQLRQKVRRGMRSSVEQGDCVIRPPFGFTRRVKLDDQGRPLIKPNGKPRTELCLDPQTAAYRREMYELFCVKNWTAYRIAREFNRRRVDDWEGWTEGYIRSLLHSPSALGVFIWDRYRREYDWEKQKFVQVENPRSQWSILYRPELSLVPVEWWKEARRKLARTRRNHPNTGKPYRRRMPVTLVSGLLICDYCGRQIVLYRSSQNCKNLFCPNGKGGKHGCQLSCSKSARIVEQALLEYLGAALFTEENLTDLVTRANAYVRQEAARPRETMQEEKARIRDLEKRIDKLVRMVEQAEDQRTSAGYDKRIRQLQHQLNDLREQVRQAEARNAPPPAPLDLGRVKDYLARLREILQQDLPVASKALGLLTGPIRIRMEKTPDGKCGGQWIARFTPDLVNLLAHLSQQTPAESLNCDRRRAEPSPASSPAGGEGQCPDSTFWEYLNHRIWTTPHEVILPLRKVYKYEQIAAEVQARIRRGDSRRDIARDLQVSVTTVVQAWRFAEHGLAGSHDSKSLRPYNPPPQPTLVDTLACTVAEELHNGATVPQLMAKYGVSRSVINRAHARWHERNPDPPGAIPHRALCGRGGVLTYEQRKAICERAMQGARECEIVREGPFTKTQVHSVLRALRRELDRLAGRPEPPRTGFEPLYRRLARFVTCRVVEDGMSLARITAWLADHGVKVSSTTVWRAYTHVNGEQLRSAAQAGRRLPGLRYGRLHPNVKAAIRSDLQAGLRTGDITAKYGVGTSTVSRIRRAMQEDGQ